jgi:hypothetical protein
MQENVRFTPGSTEDDASKEIQRIIDSYAVVLFQKGTRQSPQVNCKNPTPMNVA